MTLRTETNLTHAGAWCAMTWRVTASFRRWFAAACVGVVLITLQSAAAIGAESAHYEENQVKGAFLAKFALFVEWPDAVFSDAKSPVTIGVIGDDPFGPRYDDALSKEVANGRSFRVKRFKTPEEISGCQILFVSSSESQRLPEVLKAVGRQPILVVGDQERFAHRGGMINFVKEGGKLRFEINAAAVENSGLKMSAKLLQVSTTVKTEIEKGGR